MANKTLVIVESPGKIKKIQAALGSDYVIKASLGHVRDLPVSQLGVDTENFRPSYEFTERGSGIVKGLKAEVAKVDHVLLATDPDREGEAISWHLATSLKLNQKQAMRITFNKITKAAILDSIKNPRMIDYKLVEAQETRRVIDRLIGYMVSPALSDANGSRLSAGRVQSVAVKILVDREREIKNFVPIDHYGVTANFGEWNAKWSFLSFIPVAPTYQISNDHEKLWVNKAFASDVSKLNEFVVVSQTDKSAKSTPPPPFITSTMQRAGSGALGIKPKMVMDLAQRLYEQGLITYHRTDYPNLSDEALSELSQWGADNNVKIVSPPRMFKSKDGAQEAHEAIRPTSFNVLEAGETADEKRLYILIWKRAVASQMEDALYDVREVVMHSTTPIDNVPGTEIVFKASGRKLKYAGWRELTSKDFASDDDDNEMSNPVPKLQEGQILQAQSLKLNSEVTTPPSRYTEPSLLKELEDKGIGRPSTYAAIMNTITTRYASLLKKHLVPNEEAFKVVQTLEGKFSFMELSYTKAMEERLDNICEGKENYLRVVKGLYDELTVELQQLPRLPRPAKAQVQADSKHMCPTCTLPMIRRRSGENHFWGCSGYPNCRTTFPDVDGKPGPKTSIKK